MVGPQLDLMPGEHMVLHSHPHWWYFWKHALAAAGVLVLAVWWVTASGWFGTLLGWASSLALLAWVGYAGYAFLQWQTTRFAITDKRVAYQSGFLRRRGVSIPLNRVNNVNFEQGVVDRMLSNGTVTIESAGETGESVFRNIPHPDRVRQLIFQQMEADEQSDASREATAFAAAMRQAQPDPSPQAPAAAHERLKQLDDLLAQGLITADEHATKRAEILNSL